MHSLKRLQMSKVSYLQLCDQHKCRIMGYRENLEMIETCILHNYEVIKLMHNYEVIKLMHNYEVIKLMHNYEVIKLMLQDCQYIFLNKDGCISDSDFERVKKLDCAPPTTEDMDKVTTTLRQIVRDWSEDGRAERDVSYEPVMHAVLTRLGSRKPADVKILVPGAGLGRLVFEFARLGYSCQGNDWSLRMLLASNFILKDCWNAVVTVFFLDTAHNIIEYLETIYNILVPGGYLVNLGLLLYHWAGYQNEMSVELSYEEVRKVMLDIGFEIEKEEMNVRCSYVQNPLSLSQNYYHCIMFVARKPLPRTSHQDPSS